MTSGFLLNACIQKAWDDTSPLAKTVKKINYLRIYRPENDQTSGSREVLAPQKQLCKLLVMPETLRSVGCTYSLQRLSFSIRRFCFQDGEASCEYMKE